MEPHHLNKNPFVRHVKDAAFPHRRYLGAWESTSTERDQALGVQPFRPRGLAPASLPLPRAFWMEM